ncbi:MAG: hypothetical protein ABXS91_10515 [Sulfurimonas sp.]
MAEPITTGAGGIVSGAKAGILASIVAMFTTDQDIAMVLTVGIIGGFAYLGKEFTIKAYKKDFWGSLLNLPFSVLMSVALTGIVFYAGKDGFNAHIKDLGTYFWIFLAFMASMNYNRVIAISSMIVVKVTNKAVEKWHKF